MLNWSRGDSQSIKEKRERIKQGDTKGITL